MIDPRVPLMDQELPNMGSVTMAELRHWLGVDPYRWARAAAEAWEGDSADLHDVLASWFAAAIEAGQMDAARRMPQGKIPD